jgi:dipeptidyl-peptidase-4
MELQSSQERQLTSDGGGSISNGMAEFIAQEEMDRHSGLWWSPDNVHIAFLRVDESQVALRDRLEIGAQDTLSVQQRYPAAGESNASLRLGVVNVRTGDIRWMDLGPDPDIYVARVAWLPDGATLAVQRQSRDQRRLDLLFVEIAEGNGRVVIRESSDTWIDLHDELHFLRGQREFIWASSRDGFRHLYLYSIDGRLLRRLTQGEWIVDDFRARAIKCVDERRRLVYFTATAGDPTQRHLYVASLDTQDPGNPRRISLEEGVHAITMPATADFYIDQLSGPSQPPQVALRDIDGGLIAYLSENRLDDSHPYGAFLDEESVPDYGELQAADGARLQYRLFKPHGMDPAKRYPALLDVYGGPGVQRVLKNWTGGTFTQILTRAGYFVLQLDNRGSAFRGDRFQAPIHGRLGQIEVQDQVLGARWLAAQPQVDPTRIGVWGWSYGGYLTLMLLLTAPEIFRAGVAGAPVTDWTLYDTHYTERYLGRPQDNAAGYAASSVLTHADGLRAALLVMHGMADDNVLFTHSTRLFRKLQDLGKAFDIMAYPGGKHGLTRTKQGRHAYLTIKRFFDKHL